MHVDSVAFRSFVFNRRTFCDFFYCPATITSNMTEESGLIKQAAEEIVQDVLNGVSDKEKCDTKACQKSLLCILLRPSRYPRKRLFDNWFLCHFVFYELLFHKYVCTFRKHKFRSFSKRQVCEIRMCRCNELIVRLIEGLCSVLFLIASNTYDVR